MLKHTCSTWLRTYSCDHHACVYETDTHRRDESSPPTTHVTYNCHARGYPSLHDGNQCLDGSGSNARKAFPDFSLTLPKTQITARSELQPYFDCRSRFHLFPYLYRLAAELHPVSSERLAGSGDRRVPNLKCLCGG